MKNLFIILLSVLSLTAFAQQKKVAVLDPICRDNSVNAFYQQMVRGAMESAVTASNEYEAYDRSAFDMIQKEQAFQRTGAVSDSQIKKMGEMAGVDYVLVSEVSAYEGYLSAIVKILNVITGKYDKSIDDFAELTPESVKGKCREMASSLFGEISSSSKNIKLAAYFQVINNLYTEGPVNRDDFISPYSKIVIRDENHLNKETDYKVTSFKVNVLGSQYLVEGEQFTEEIIARLASCKRGQFCIIREIAAINIKTRQKSSFRGMTLYPD